MAKTYYGLLGVNRTAGPRRIKRAYRELAKRFHPDSCQPGSDAARFREVTHAYETLSDTERRRRYDSELRAMDERVSAPRLPRRAQRAVEDDAPAEPALRSRVRLEEDILFEVVLSQAEAARGGVFPIHVPVTGTCPECGAGLGRIFCPVCAGRGILVTEQQIGLSIPPGVPHGLEATLRFDGIWASGRRVHVRILIDPEA
jgi:molecular chaperone DnaJ